MSQAVYLIFFLVTILAVISTPANASPLEKKWNKNCCPVSVCEFKQGQIVNAGVGTLTNYVSNTFDGILSFTESPKNTLQISGFIDIEGVTTKTIGDFPGWDLHVAPCNTAKSTEPGDLAPRLNTGTIDLDTESFDKPIRTSVTTVNTVNGPKPASIDRIKDQCCFVVSEFHLGANEFILGIAKVQPVVLADCSTPTTPIPFAATPTPTPSGNSTA